MISNHTRLVGKGPQRIDSREQKLRDEIALLQNLIDGRVWQGNEPVYPTRARDGLARAQRELASHFAETDGAECVKATGVGCKTMSFTGV